MATQPKPLTKANMKAFAKSVQKQIAASGFVILVGVEDVIHEPSGLRMSELAAIHEYGTETVPARAPFGVTMAKNRVKYTKALKTVTEDVLATKTFRKATQLGLTAVGDVQSSIATGLNPPLKSATVKAKGSSKPLIDTGAFRQSITSEVLHK